MDPILYRLTLVYIDPLSNPADVGGGAKDGQGLADAIIARYINAAVL